MTKNEELLTPTLSPAAGEGIRGRDWFGAAVARMSPLAGLLLLLGACGDSSGPSGPDPDGDADADADADGGPEPAGFEADERPSTGPAAWLEATLAGPDVDVTVRTRDLGAIFGLSAHVSWDPEALVLATPVERGATEALLDPEQSGAAVAIAIARPGDVALGGTRASPADGEVTVEGEAMLATVRLRAVQAGRLRLEITRAILAYADGRLLPLPASGGALVAMEVAP